MLFKSRVHSHINKYQQCFTLEHNNIMEIKESSSAFLLMEYQDLWQTYSKLKTAAQIWLI